MVIHNSIRFHQHHYMITSILVNDFVNSSKRFLNFGNKDMNAKFEDFGLRFHQYWYMISSIPTKDFVNTNKQFHQYRKTILSIPVNNFINTSKRFLPYQQWYIFNDLSKFDVEIEDFKNINRNMPRYRIKKKRRCKISIQMSL